MNTSQEVVAENRTSNGQDVGRNANVIPFNQLSVEELYEILRDLKAQEPDKAKRTQAVEALKAQHGEELTQQIIDRIKQEDEDDSASQLITVADMRNFDRDADESTLVGNRWLCKGAQVVIQGPTGVGKSSLIMQWSIRLTLGLPFFGIKPVKPMRVLLVQAENDVGDMSEAFQDMTNAMSAIKENPLTNDDIKTISERLTIKRVDSISGGDFAGYLERQIERHSPDVVFVDPLLAYIGGDALAQKVMSPFLREMINPVLRRTGALLIWVHHTSKPGRSANGHEKTAEENKYSGLGSSDLQNACREVISFSDMGDGIFNLAFTKRGRRLGLKDDHGNPVSDFNIQHHKDGIVWQKAKGIIAFGNKSAIKGATAVELVRDYIINKGTVSSSALRTWAGTTGGKVAVNNVVNIAKAVTEEHVTPKGKPRIYPDMERTGKSGPKSQVFTTVEPEWSKAKREAETSLDADDQGEMFPE